MVMAGAVEGEYTLLLTTLLIMEFKQIRITPTMLKIMTVNIIQI
jgi:hypothetical protein